MVLAWWNIGVLLLQALAVQQTICRSISRRRRSFYIMFCYWYELDCTGTTTTTIVVLVFELANIETTLGFFFGFLIFKM